jgi:tetratricopeptide (TPR) repeat protein
VLLKAISKQVIASTEDSFSRELKLSELLSAGLALDRLVALQVLEARLKAITSEREWNRLLDQVARGLFGHSVYGQLASDIRKGESRQRFQELAALFREDAPLELIDRLSRKQSGTDDLSALLNRFLDEKDHVIVQLISEAMRAKRFAEQGERFEAFLIGVVAAACEQKVFDTTHMSLQEVVTLLAADLAEPRHFEALVARLGTFDQAEVMPALAESLAREQTTYGSIVMATAMGELGWDGFTTPLTAAMGEDCGDLLCEAAKEALIRIGEPARDHLIRHWGRLDDSQQIYGLSVIEAIGGEPAASFAVDRYDELFHDDPENWCQLALSTPEPRLLALVEEHLPRQQRLFDETFYQMAQLLGVAHPDLEAIAERVRKARADGKARRAAMERGDWFNETLRLELKCPACGDSNEYEVQRVAVNPGSKQTDLLLAHEFPCVSCGHWVDFEFTPGAHMALSAELLKLTSDRDAELVGQSKVLIMVEAPYNGQRLAVGEVVSRCKAALADDPGSIADWLRLGYCYHQLLFHPNQGLEYAERALALEPNAVEAVLQKAEAMTMQGEEEAAFELLDQALESRENWRFFLTDIANPAQLTAQFAHSYNGLLRRLDRIDRAILHATFLGVSKKVGRNDPCPCGSGKKYKKCCLARH